MPLPPVPPQVGWRKSMRLPRDHYVRLDANDYSVHPAVIGRRIEVHADLDSAGSGSRRRLPAGRHETAFRYKRVDRLAKVVRRLVSALHTASAGTLTARRCSPPDGSSTSRACE